MNQQVDQNSAHDWETYAAVEDALRTMELEEVSPGLADSVMRRVSSSTPRPVFRLAWIDYALSLFAAGMLGLVALLSGTLPPELNLYLRQEALYWLLRIQIEPLTPVLLFGGAILAVGGCLLVGAMFFRYVLPGGRAGGEMTE